MGNIISMQLFPLQLCFIRVMLRVLFFLYFLPNFFIIINVEVRASLPASQLISCALKLMIM